MRKQFFITTIFTLLIFSSFSQTDSSKTAIDTAKANYNVDKFEHGIFFQASGPQYYGVWITAGYEFYYNFKEHYRLISTVGYGFGIFSGLHGFLIRPSIEMGKRLARFEVGINQQFSFADSESFYSVGPSFAFNLRHHRGFAGGISWNPVWGSKERTVAMFQFALKFRVYINSAKRRKALGKWKGAHPFRDDY